MKESPIKNVGSSNYKETHAIDIENKINKLGEKRKDTKNKRSRMEIQKNIDKLNAEKKALIGSKREDILKSYAKEEKPIVEEKTNAQEVIENKNPEIATSKNNWIKNKFKNVLNYFNKTEKTPEPVVEKKSENKINFMSPTGSQPFLYDENKPNFETEEIEDKPTVETKKTEEVAKDESTTFKTGDKVEFSGENFDTVKKVEEFENIPNELEDTKNTETKTEAKEWWEDELLNNNIKGEEEGNLSMEEEIEGWGMGERAKEIFGKMSSGGKNLFSSLYKGINNIPVVDRMIAKTGIAYNQFWIDKKEEKSLELKDKMDGLDEDLNDLNSAKLKVQIIMSDLEKHGEKGSGSLILEIKKIEENERKIANKKDKLQTRIEIRENSIKLYANKRDAIADGMINKYNEKLSPIQENLKNLETERDILNIYKLGKEAEAEEKNNEIEFFIKQKEMLMESLLLQKISIEKANRHKSMKKFNEEIENRKNIISKTKLEIEKRQESINKKVEKADKKANPYKDKRNEFIRVTNRKSIKIELEERVNLEENTEKEEINAHKRKDGDKGESINNEQKTSGPESSYSGYENNPKMFEVIDGLNQFIKSEKFDTSLFVDTEKIFKIIKKETRVTTNKFKEIIVAYYKFKKVPESVYKKLIDNIK